MVTVVLTRKEAGYTDADNDGEVDGTGITMLTEPLAGSDGYGSAAADTDNSGVADYLEAGVAISLFKVDADGDGIDDSATDLDDDNDGIYDTYEGDDSVDTDSDGIPDYLDTDSDGDGCNDAIEAGFTDANDDGIVDGNGVNADGTISGSDGYILPQDLDNNGIADHLDANFFEACFEDSDNDGINDEVDLDDDNDGIFDAYEGDDTVDTDGDGIPDYLDTDSDGDGCTDAQEAGFTDADSDGVVDGTGIAADGTVIGSDGYNFPADADNNGIADHLDANYRIVCLEDVDGDGIDDSIDLDNDNDGIYDSYEGDDTVDTDGDGTPDYLDLDSDGDGCSDATEAGFTDANDDGIVDGDGIAADGTVTGSDGYIVPQDEDNNAIPDHLDPNKNDACDLSNALEVIKTAELTNDDNNNGKVDAGDTLTYTIMVTNKGPFTLTNITVLDLLSDINGNAIANLTAVYDATNTTSEGILTPGETATYSVIYIANQDNVNVGGLSNTALVSAEGPHGDINDPSDDVIDVSDDGNPDNGDDDPTVTVITSDSALHIIKTAVLSQDVNANEKADAGDELLYTIAITNTGNVSLTNLEIEDIMQNGNGDQIFLTTGPDYSSSNVSVEGVIESQETVIYTATYVVTQTDIDSGEISNIVTAKAEGPNGDINDITDDITGISDDGINSNGLDNPTVYEFSQQESIEVVKTYTMIDNGDEKIGLNDVIDYTITVTNDGDVTLSNVQIIDMLTDYDGDSMELTSGPDFETASKGSVEGVLLPSEVARYKASFVINKDAIEAGGVQNRVEAFAETPLGFTISDMSDDGDDDDGNLSDDPTRTTIPSVEGESAIEIFNGISPDGDGYNDFFRIEGIENYQNNVMQIFNRWGVLVYSVYGYGGSNGTQNVFKGYSEGRTTVSEGERLPAGTYYYILRFDKDNPGRQIYTGYLYLNRN